MLISAGLYQAARDAAGTIPAGRAARCFSFIASLMLPVAIFYHPKNEQLAEAPVEAATATIYCTDFASAAGAAWASIDGRVFQRRILELMIDKRGDGLLGVELVFVDRHLRRLGREIDEHILRTRLLGKISFTFAPQPSGHIISGTLNSTVGAPACVKRRRRTVAGRADRRDLRRLLAATDKK